MDDPRYDAVQHAVIEVVRRVLAQHPDANLAAPAAQKNLAFEVTQALGIRRDHNAYASANPTYPQPHVYRLACLETPTTAPRHYRPVAPSHEVGGFRHRPSGW